MAEALLIETSVPNKCSINVGASVRQIMQLHYYANMHRLEASLDNVEMKLFNAMVSTIMNYEWVRLASTCILAFAYNWVIIKKCNSKRFEVCSCLISSVYSIFAKIVMGVSLYDLYFVMQDRGAKFFLEKHRRRKLATTQRTRECTERTMEKKLEQFVVGNTLAHHIFVSLNILNMKKLFYEISISPAYFVSPTWN
ncbi:hypothetical protein GQX74_007261 [Glossina fuscipes]|nr:hypothetical protein GQX74_007261 [Glossina fuscipes]